MIARRTTLLAVVVCVCWSYISCHQAHPPGIPPPVNNMQQQGQGHGHANNMQQQGQGHGHAPGGHETGGHGQPSGFGVGSHEAE